MAAVLLASGCRLIDASRGEGAGEGDGDGETADAACGTTPLVVDDFEDGVTGPEWIPYNDPGAELEEADGVLRVAYSAADPAWAGYATVESHDIRGGSISAEIAQVGGMTILEFHSGDTKVQTYADYGTLRATIMVGTETTSALEIEYLPDVHVHWRMREDSGTVHWETSADGADWTEIDARPTPLVAEDVTLVVTGGGVEGDPPAEFESVDIELADCRASSL